MNITENVSQSSMLKCHCDICPKTNYTCSTDGICFTSVTSEADGSLNFQYRYSGCDAIEILILTSFLSLPLTRCVTASSLFPPENPIICNINSNSNKYSAIYCCKTDFCNDNKSQHFLIHSNVTSSNSGNMTDPHQPKGKPSFSEHDLTNVNVLLFFLTTLSYPIPYSPFPFSLSLFSKYPCI